MESLLALDIGTRRTGVAFFDTRTSIPFPLDTIEHQSVEELLGAVGKIAEERLITRLIIGLPRLPSGEEGVQATYTRAIVEKFRERNFTVTLVDERYSTPRSTTGDGDAAAAVEILRTHLRM